MVDLSKGKRKTDRKRIRGKVIPRKTSALVNLYCCLFNGVSRSPTSLVWGFFLLKAARPRQPNITKSLRTPSVAAKWPSFVCLGGQTDCPCDGQRSEPECLAVTQALWVVSEDPIVCVFYINTCVGATVWLKHVNYTPTRCVVAGDPALLAGSSEVQVQNR